MYSTNTTLSREEFADLLEKWTDKYVNNMTPDQLREHVAEDLFNTLWSMRKYSNVNEIFEEMINWGGEDLLNEVVS